MLRKGQEINPYFSFRQILEEGDICGGIADSLRIF